MISNHPNERQEQHYGVAGVVLAGGASRRMGRNKALLPMPGQTLVERLAARLYEITDLVCISANDPLTYSFLDLPVICDLFPGCGPLAGIHAALLHSPRPWIMALACDLPNVSAAFLRRLIASSAGFDAVIPTTSDGSMHPVCALYHRNCLPYIERSLRREESGIIQAVDNPGLRIRRLPYDEEEFPGFQLLDLDCPADYEQYLQLFKP